jgi:hypothetical protein
MRIILLTLTFILSFPAYILSIPEGPLPDAVLSKSIKTVQCYRTGWEFSYPILDLNSDATLQISFDELGTESKIFNYVIVLCDADWMPARVSFAEYLDGFYQNSVNDFASSFSTHIQYTHYKLQIPNENVKLRLAGNYVLIVYESDEDHPVLMKRFVIADKRVEINASVVRPINPEFQNSFQQVDFNIAHPNYSIDDPIQTIKVTVVKNNQWKFANSHLHPLFIRNKELVYQDHDQNLYPGGNEYRSVDFKSLKYQEPNVRSLINGNNGYEAIFKPDARRDNKGYTFQKELNGCFLIQNQQGSQPDVDAEYVNVLFSFPMNAPMIDGDMFLFGGFTDFNCYDDYKLQYNYEHMAYEVQTLLKQGYYNYQYVYVPKNTNDVDEGYFEGNYYDTENSYAIYVYHRPFGSRYDKLIGVTVVSSLYKAQKW